MRVATRPGPGPHSSHDEGHGFKGKAVLKSRLTCG